MNRNFSLVDFPLFAKDLERQGYVQINPGMIEMYLQMFDSDCDMRSALGIVANSVLSGGVLFERKAVKLSDQARNWFSDTWGRSAGKEGLRYALALGFAIGSYVPHPVHGQEPVMIDLTQVDVYYKLNEFGKTHYRILKRPKSGLMMLDPESLLNGTGSRAEEIFNITPFEMNPPTSKGEIRSVISVLISDLLFDDHMMRCARIATWTRANPLLVTEQVQERYDPNNVPTASTLGNVSSTACDMYGDGTAPKSSVFVYDDYPSSKKEMTRFTQGTGIKTNPTLYQQLYIDNGRKLVQPQSPEMPSEWIQFRLARQEKVFNAFGIPLSMMSGVSTRGGKKETGTGSNGSSTNAQLIFLNAQKELKSQLIAFMKRLYMQMYDEQHVREYIEEARRAKNEEEKEEPKGSPLKIDWNKVNEHIDVEITLPGIPDDQILNDLFVMGVLRYDALISYLSARYAIPMDSFNVKPELSALELNGMQEQLPPATSSIKK